MHGSEFTFEPGLPAGRVPLRRMVVRLRPVSRRAESVQLHVRNLATPLLCTRERQIWHADFLQTATEWLIGDVKNKKQRRNRVDRYYDTVSERVRKRKEERDREKAQSFLTLKTTLSLSLSRKSTYYRSSLDFFLFTFYFIFQKNWIFPPPPTTLLHIQIKLIEYSIKCV